MDRIEVYYNSACPVCAAGINSQRRRMEGQPAEAVAWLDVHAQPEHCRVLGSDLETVRERLHVRGADGTVLVGMDAVVALMRQTPGQRWLAWLFGLPLVAPLSRWAYNAFARVLYSWNRSRHHW